MGLFESVTSPPHPASAPLPKAHVLVNAGSSTHAYEF